MTPADNPSASTPFGQVPPASIELVSCKQPARYSSTSALQRAVQSFLGLQRPDGSWEGEVAWCPLLTAQYVLTCHLTHIPIPLPRREALLRQFAAARLPSGVWGLHEKSEPYLMVTALVYVAARVLGCARTDPLLAAAEQFVRAQGGVVAIPSQGKFWLAMLNLYEWQGVQPILPEAWRLPQWLPACPSNFYCHTRLIYIAMAIIYGRKFQAPVTPLTEALRAELYLSDYHAIDFAAAREMLRREEVFNPPGIGLRLVNRLNRAYERWHPSDRRQRVLAQLVDQIRFELRTTHCMAISPVSGLLNIIALWLHDPADPDLAQARQGLETWMWQDEQQGLRLAGARSQTWDTAFAIQALQVASRRLDLAAVVSRAQSFLVTQQVRVTIPDFEKYHRLDPQGGYCFAGAWHRWPVSDCTAEALLALRDAPAETDASETLPAAVRFMLRCQNADGGFGSYERRRTASTLEWLNPAETFANSMTEHSYVECTASCLAALCEYRRLQPAVLSRDIETSVRRGTAWLRRQQRPDGSWPGFWGVHFIYGTLFGIRGLLSVGVRSDERAIGKACQWLIERQKRDGGWGEHFRGCLTGRYVEHHESQVIQTAWALMALLEAQAPLRDPIERGIQFLSDKKLENGSWPKQDPAGVFFQTALLDYTLYRCYFPLWALALYEADGG